MRVIPGLFVLLLSAAAAGAEVDFAHQIVPLLKERCGTCHSSAKKEGNFSINTRQLLLAGGESGPAVVAGKSKASELYQRITSKDDTVRMPPEGEPLTAAEVALLARWIDEGAKWETGFTFGPQAYEPPLAPRTPELPPATAGRDHPIDRILTAYVAERQQTLPARVDDAAFLRRASLDLIGLLPTPEERASYVDSRAEGKQARLVQELLARDVDYAEHWLSFWNDLLRNDYTGTGFITGGRKQISKWLYEALVANKPYDQFARELIAPPTPQSAGFIEGIRWRGEVSAGQTVEIQFAQSIGQTFLGINLKCASCHDSFIDRWTLAEAYGLAAIYATTPLELHRCDKPTGKTAKAAWLFPELGQIDPEAPQDERLQQLAALLTHPQNGRFTRTIVNRLWHRLMGRGIVHPTDAMQTEPWSADLLDYLASHLAGNGYDLKKTLELIATSEAYQSRVEISQGMDEDSFVFAGPRAKRLTAEQFMDAVWQISGAAPSRFDAPVLRGKPDPSVKRLPLVGKWIWTEADPRKSPGGETITVSKTVELKDTPAQAVAAIACDNSYVLYVNGKQVQAGDNWEAPDTVIITDRLKSGANEFVIVATNTGPRPNAAALFCELRLIAGDGSVTAIGTDEGWQWTRTKPNANGRFTKPPTDWQAAAVITQPRPWSRADKVLEEILTRAPGAPNLMVRASLVRNDFLMRSLGRPHREQIASVRPSELTTLEAIDLSNGQSLASALERGARKQFASSGETPATFVRWLYQYALSREPTAEEMRLLSESLGDKLTEESIEDALWTVIMLPEFQLVR